MDSNISKLREETGAGVMDCKKALDAAKGNYETAKKVLVAQGIAKAEKKEAREVKASHLESYIHAGRVGVLLEVQAETDFAIKSEPFQNLAKNLAMQIAAMSPASVEELLKQPYIKDESLTIESFIKTVIAKVGENIKVAKFCRYEV